MIVGIIGGGQLGRMLALAGIPLGIQTRALDPGPDPPARRGSDVIVARYDDREALARLAAGADVVTYEFENVPVEAAEWLATRAPLLPPPAALAVAQDRLREKQFFNAHGIETPRFAAVDSRAALVTALGEFGTPAILKTRRLGYDGKGQVRIDDPREAGDAWERLRGAPLILEAFVPFERELSILAARSTTGDVAFYPLVENHHRSGILRRSLAPAPLVSALVRTRAQAIAGAVLEALDYRGVMAIELFQSGERLLANEMAPRVHNSGHWTIEGAETSQFENHLRAILGLPLGSPAARGYAAMLNLIGRTPDPARVLAIPGAHLHLYDKAPRPGRKLGHVTVTGDDFEDVQARVARLESLIE